MTCLNTNDLLDDDPDLPGSNLRPFVLVFFRGPHCLRRNAPLASWIRWTCVPPDPVSPAHSWLAYWSIAEINVSQPRHVLDVPLGSSVASPLLRAYHIYLSKGGQTRPTRGSPTFHDVWFVASSCRLHDICMDQLRACALDRCKPFLVRPLVPPESRADSDYDNSPWWDCFSSDTP